MELKSFDIKDFGTVKAPSSWSETAVEIAATKYFRQIGKNKKESSVPQLIRRVSVAIAKQVERQGLGIKTVKNFQKNLEALLFNQKAAFNSPVWFNVGLYEAYGIQTKSPHWAWDPKKKKILPVGKNFFKRPQASACFIQSGPRNLQEVMQLAETENLLFRYGSGTGSNFTSLPSHYEEETPGAPSPGVLNFLDFLDRGAAMVKSGGVARRAAKMVVMNIEHPEILDFVNWKKEEERKAKALISKGFDAAFEGEVYKFLSGQNANNSVRVTDEFMKKVEDNGEWLLKDRSGKEVARVSAAMLWQQISEAAWECADPGVQFHDTINSWNPCRDIFEINASNPCSEYMFIDDSACNLASINLVSMLDESGVFQIDEYLCAVDMLIRSQEALIDYASYPTQKIAQNSHIYRPLGLGFANLGALLMQMGLSYDSDEARCFAALLASTMTAQAYLTSCKMAEKKGAFAGFKKNKKSFMRVLKKHQDAHLAIKKSTSAHLSQALINDLFNQTEKIWQKVVEKADKTGVRNAQVTLLAPTGTIGLLMDCDTLGIEPEFSLLKHKVLSGGGELRIENRSVDKALNALGVAHELKKDIFKYLESFGHLSGAPHLTQQQQKVFSCATGPGALSPHAHLAMMAAVQPFLSGAISKTVNCPNTTSVADIAQIYLQAWKLGLKSVAIYRDGSKGSQPLNSILECGTGECVI